MGFWDEYEEIGGDFVKGAEKEVLAANGIPFQVEAVLDDDESQFGARYVLRALVPDPENGEERVRSMAFAKASVDSRDRMLSAMQTFLADGGDPVSVKLEKAGRSWLLREA
jgi:hypothetical protein